MFNVYMTVTFTTRKNKLFLTLSVASIFNIPERRNISYMTSMMCLHAQEFVGELGNFQIDETSEQMIYGDDEKHFNP